MIFSAYFGSTYCGVFRHAFFDLGSSLTILSAVKSCSVARARPSTTASAILLVNRRMARKRVVIAGITQSTSSGSQLVSTMATPECQPAGFLHGDGFLVGIDHEEHIRQAGHVLDTGKVLSQMLALALQADDFLLGRPA